MANRTQYTGIDDPLIPANVKRRYNTPEKLQAWVDKHNADWKTVQTCTVCDPPHPLTAREVGPHILTHVQSTRARQIIGTIQHPRTKPADIAEVKAYLAAHTS